jgi:hypothetical protein
MRCRVPNRCLRNNPPEGGGSKRRAPDPDGLFWCKTLDLPAVFVDGGDGGGAAGRSDAHRKGGRRESPNEPLRSRSAPYIVFEVPQKITDGERGAVLGTKDVLELITSQIHEE